MIDGLNPLALGLLAIAGFIVVSGRGYSVGIKSLMRLLTRMGGFLDDPVRLTFVGGALVGFTLGRSGTHPFALVGWLLELLAGLLGSVIPL